MSTELDNTLFGIFAQRQDAQQAAQALVYSTIRSTVVNALGLNQNTGKSRAFQLILSQPPSAAALNAAASAAAAAAAAAASGMGTIAMVSKATKGPGTTVSTITFDVAPGSNINGFAQRVNYELRARQSTQHTLAGFAVNEFGMGPGHLDVDCMVVWSSSPNSDISAFFSMLENAKKTTPADSTAPSQLRFVDSFLGKTLTITQESVSLEQSEENQNYGRLKISATVLYDADSSSPPVSVLTPAQQSGQTALKVLQSLLSLT